jgi:hypothetical protein
MPLGMPNTSQPIYPTMYGTTPPRYPTAPYYQYPHAPGYYPTIPNQSASAPPATSSSAPPPTQFVSTSTAATSTLTMATSNPAGASGAWADEEVERLKRLADQSRSSGSSNETDWDWVVAQWGNTRTRPVIFLNDFSVLLTMHHQTSNSPQGNITWPQREHNTRRQTKARRRDSKYFRSSPSACTPHEFSHECCGACTLSCAKPDYHFRTVRSAIARNT